MIFEPRWAPNGASGRVDAEDQMYRVVKDRERWFGVAMGETPDSGEWATERDAARVPLPEKLAESLTLNLALDKAPSSPQPGGPTVVCPAAAAR
jgi:hypothetical protein